MVSKNIFNLKKAIYHRGHSAAKPQPKEITPSHPSPLEGEAVKKLKFGEAIIFLLSRGWENSRRQNRRDIHYPSRVHLISAKERRQIEGTEGKGNKIR